MMAICPALAVVAGGTPRNVPSRMRGGALE